MRALRRMWHRLAGSLSGSHREAELADEFESHIEMATEENLRRGMPPSEARRTALLLFGGVELSKDHYRDQRGFPWLADLRQDVSYAIRGMRRSPGFTAVVLICLALGIGANTAVFSVLNGILIRSLPVRDPGSLVLLSYKSKDFPETVLHRTSGMGQLSLPYSAFDTFRRRSQALSGIFAFAPLGLGDDSLTVMVSGRAMVAGGEMVSGDYFAVLGVAPLIGRLIAEDDLKPVEGNVAVLSHSYWSRVFGRDPSVLGRTITLNGQPFTIVGVTPPEFFGLNPAFAPDIWVPLRNMTGLTPWGARASKGVSMFKDRFWWWCMMAGRLKPGVTMQQASAELNTLFHQCITEGLQPAPGSEKLPQLVLYPAGRGLENLRKTFSGPLKVLTFAVSLILLIACVNVATLLLARTSARRREMNIRLAIGASRSRLIRQLLTESVLLSICGGLLGGFIALWAGGALLHAMSGHIPSGTINAGPNPTVFAFTASVSVLTGILFGLAPALRGTPGVLSPNLKDNNAGSTSRQTLTKALITAQAALSVVLLFGAGLFLRTWGNLEGQDFGFHRENLLLVQIDPRRTGYEPGRVLAAYSQALERLRSLPGVQSVTLSRYALLSGWANNSPVSTDSADSPPSIPGRLNGTDWNIVGPDYFTTMGIPILLGRGISKEDVAGRRRVAVISEEMAHDIFGNRDPLGHGLSFGSRYNPEERFEIIGVAKDIKWTAMREARPRTAYVPYTSPPSRVGIGAMYLVVRTPADPLRLIPSVRETMFQVDPNIPLFDVKTQNGQIEEALTQERLLARFTSLLGLLALLLVSVGLYGTLGYAVTRRTNEMGIRIALGASRHRVLRMVVLEGMALIAYGLVAGLPAALAVSRIIASLLFGVKTYDTATILGTSLVLALIGVTAGILPATRASRIEPTRALHYE